MAAPDPPESPGVPLTRRALRERGESSDGSPHTARRATHVEPFPRTGSIPSVGTTSDTLVTPTSAHARRRRATRTAVVFGFVAAAIVLFGGTAAVIAAVSAPPFAEANASAVDELDVSVSGVPQQEPLPPVAGAIPAPVVAPQAVGDDICAADGMQAALDARDAAGAIAAAGGAERFRAAVAAGTAPCVALDDPTQVWVVVNKARPYAPVDFRPAELVAPEGVRNIPGTALRPEVSAALSALVRGAADAGAGELALLSGFRAYDTQVDTYSSHVHDRGQEGADQVSARPGHSEHQAGLAADLVACDPGGCGGLDDLAGTSQGDWVAAHAWEYGFVVRYEEGFSGVTGYAAEPWHLRYVGADLARLYHEGGWHTLESFFGLPAAPGYEG